MKRLNWGIIGTGGIADDFTQALKHSPTCRVIAGLGSSGDKSKAFQEKWSLDHAPADLDQLLKIPDLGAVYIATPHPRHFEHASQCLRAKVPVLCEKPLTLDASSTQALIQVARDHETFLQEAFMYRCHPLIHAILEDIQEGAIGAVKHVRAEFGFRLPRDPKHRLYAPELGGGSILDVGGYPASFARLIAGLVQGQPFAEPIHLEAKGQIGPTGVDELASAILTFEDGLTADLSCAIHHQIGTQAIILGEEGRIVCDDPWIPKSQRQGLVSSYKLGRDDHEEIEKKIETERPIYALEAESFARSLSSGEVPWPTMSLDDTLGNMKTLDRWQAAIKSS